MQHISVEPPAFFHRGPSPLSRLALLGLLSIALLFADTRFRYLEGVRQVVAIALYPFQRAILLPSEAFNYVADYFGSKRQLADENARLKEQLAAQTPRASSAALLEGENVRLKALLDTARRYPHAAIAAEVLYMGRDPFSQKVFINKGVDAGVKAGDAVIDELGVVGQVTRAYPMMGEVTLLTERDYAVPVKIERSGIRSLLFGNGTGRSPELRFTAPSADIKVGDRLVTSGIDGTYPAGLAVAEVVDIDRDTGQMFARIACKPLAGVDRSQFLLVLGRDAAQPTRPEEPAETESVKKGRRGRRG
ncbi:MAG TPA: rod shape-determining protein MreC [Casimicrobiaceae bacterium]|jgi:rod shape-determining protein MreC